MTDMSNTAFFKKCKYVWRWEHRTSLCAAHRISSESDLRYRIKKHWKRYIFFNSLWLWLPERCSLTCPNPGLDVAAGASIFFDFELTCWWKEVPVMKLFSTNHIFPFASHPPAHEMYRCTPLQDGNRSSCKTSKDSKSTIQIVWGERKARQHDLEVQFSQASFQHHKEGEEGRKRHSLILFCFVLFSRQIALKTERRNLLLWNLWNLLLSLDLQLI